MTEIRLPKGHVALVDDEDAAMSPTPKPALDRDAVGALQGKDAQSPSPGSGATRVAAGSRATATRLDRPSNSRATGAGGSTPPAATTGAVCESCRETCALAASPDGTHAVCAARIRALPTQHPGGDAAGLEEALEKAADELSATAHWLHRIAIRRYAGTAQSVQYAATAARDALEACRRASPERVCATCKGTKRYYGADNELVGPCPDCASPERVSLRPAREVACKATSIDSRLACPGNDGGYDKFEGEHNRACDIATAALEADRRSR